jgi:hypothetical protein
MHSTTISTVSPKLSKINLEESSVKRIEQWRWAVVSDTALVLVSVVFCLPTQARLLSIKKTWFSWDRFRTFDWDSSKETRIKSERFSWKSGCSTDFQ